MRRLTARGRHPIRLPGLVRMVAIGAAVLCVTDPLTTSARADGDPGSDVLVYQPLFFADDARLPAAEQVRLGNLVHDALTHGFPVRVAIIATPNDLGAVTALWRKPEAYARFLGIELSLTYKGRLLVVMPNGYGFNWPGHPVRQEYSVLNAMKERSGPAGLGVAAERAITALAAAHGVHVAPVPVVTNSPSPAKQAAQTSPSKPRRAPTSSRALAFLALTLLGALIVAARVLYGRHH